MELNAIILAVGGIGVFLLGMIIMTEGLKALAGARISQWLADRTSSPWSGAATGALGTAILQSSSATTVAAVGFVGAGLLTFPQALGIIFGANIGTTITGWMVALLGFKLQLGSLLLPAIFVGVLLRFFANARLGQVGYALAGFGLVFLGIDLLQQAAAGYSDIFDLQTLAADTWSVRLQLVAVGIVITLLTQSSSAGVAATLVAINAGAINFQQGAALVIGMDVGTTVTAAIATIGATQGARRTGFSHVIYNCMTAVVALILISPFTHVWPKLTGVPILSSPEIALVAFHTTFNLIGALLVLPFTPKFAGLMQKLVPDTLPRYARALDRALLREPSVALLTARQIIVSEFLTLMVSINLILEQAEDEIRADMNKLQRILDETHQFLDRITIPNFESRESRHLIAMIHAIDHMQRLHERCDEDLERALNASQRQELVESRSVLDEQIDLIIEAIEQRDFEHSTELATATYNRCKELEIKGRDQIYLAVARDRIDVRYATECAEALRWLTRVSRHISRISHYLQASASSS